MTLIEFLEYIDPIFFRVPARNLDLSVEEIESQTNAQTKRAFIRKVLSNALKTQLVLDILGDAALKNGLNKIHPSERLGTARTAAEMINVPFHGKKYRQEESSPLERTSESIIKTEGIASFLELIHPAYFKTACVEAGIFSPISPGAYTKTSSVLKSEFIEYVKSKKLKPAVVLNMMGESATANALQKRLGQTPRGFGIPPIMQQEVSNSYTVQDNLRARKPSSTEEEPWVSDFHFFILAVVWGGLASFGSFVYLMAQNYGYLEATLTALVTTAFTFGVFLIFFPIMCMADGTWFVPILSFGGLVLWAVFHFILKVFR